jgi:hypothetical protein
MTVIVLLFVEVWLVERAFSLFREEALMSTLFMEICFRSPAKDDELA